MYFPSVLFWTENVAVVEWTLLIWDNLVKYTEAGKGWKQSIAKGDRFCENISAFINNEPAL